MILEFSPFLVIHVYVSIDFNIHIISLYGNLLNSSIFLLQIIGETSFVRSYREASYLWFYVSFISQFYAYIYDVLLSAPHKSESVEDKC